MFIKTHHNQRTDIVKLGHLLELGMTDLDISKELKICPQTVRINRRKKFPQYTGKGPRGPKDCVTVGEISRLCKVALRTVTVWCDNGVLPYFRISGSNYPHGHRRVYKSDLQAFLICREMPIPVEIKQGIKITYGLRSDEVQYDWRCVPNALELGALAATENVSNAVVGDGYGVGAAIEAVTFLQKSSPAASIVLVVSEDVTIRWQGIVHYRPFEVIKLLQGLENV